MKFWNFAGTVHSHTALETGHFDGPAWEDRAFYSGTTGKKPEDLVAVDPKILFSSSVWVCARNWYSGERSSLLVVGYRETIDFWYLQSITTPVFAQVTFCCVCETWIYRETWIRFLSRDHLQRYNHNLNNHNNHKFAITAKCREKRTELPVAPTTTPRCWGT